MATYARINKDGVPMHKHEPIPYWDWPWKNHASKAPGAHKEHDVVNPIWVKDVKLMPYIPTDAEKELYAQALVGPTQAYKVWDANRKGKKGKTVVERATKRQDSGEDQSSTSTKYQLKRI